MQILVVVERSPRQRFLVDLHTDSLAREVYALVNRKRYSKAIVTALAKGAFMREVGPDELCRLSARLILSEEGASWDLMR